MSRFRLKPVLFIMFHSIVLFAALLALASSKTVNKREIGRDTNHPAFGEVVQPDEAHLYRYQVAVGTNCGQHCGGVIISDRFILTAAHCVFGTDPRSLTIKAGITFVNDKNAQFAEVVHVKIHRNHIPPSDKNDIALLLLQEPLDLTNLTVARLPEVGESFVGEVFEASGWGSTKNLTYALETVVEAPTCEHMSRLCAEALRPKMGTTFGDSGGPAVIRRGNEVILIGLVRGNSDGFDVFSNIANLRPWIDEAIIQAVAISKVLDRYLGNLPKHRCR